MDMLSIDVWQHVFEFACTDGGRTAAALSRISKAVQGISAPFRFYSVELHSLKQVQKFLTAYEAALAAASGAQNDPPHVRHLRLAFLPGETDMFVLGPSFHFRDFHSWQGVKVEWNARFVELMTRLFALIGPDLKTMTVLQNNEILLPYVRATFPNLRELTLLDEDRMFLRSELKPDGWAEPSDKDFYSAGPPPNKDELAASPIFPALERLHLIEGNWQDTLPLWVYAAPRLAHLRLSSAKAESCEALRNTLQDSTSFKALRTVIVSPQSGKDAALADASLEAIRDISTVRPNIRLVTLPGAQHRLPEKYWYDWLSQQWRARAVGEEGPWVTSVGDEEKR
ncbi:hypothetical protein C8Q76DRAFT_23823 [Earliella scabrosa]|nr:hypothetical protein C8Q76DRAFT_23823 [Earliella scabrosa]